MCGICGIVLDSPSDELPSTVGRMTGTLVHRGPDSGGRHVEGRVGLGHRRLSILDLSPAGAQPMTRTGPSVWLSFNGEVYNFRELRSELEGRGVAFESGSDTEVILEAYRSWGIDGLDRLEGIFALALWDADRERLILQRDRLGVKPLFYARPGPGEVVFGSEIKAVLASGKVGTALDDQAFSEYLWYGNAFSERTIYRDVHQLLPGHRLVLEGGQVSVGPWWTLENWIRSADSSDWTPVRVREAVDEAVRRQLVSDVPVGIFLSGGVDSSVIAASAVRSAGERLSSYAVGFDFEFEPSELPKARLVADTLGLDHHELMVSGSSIEDVIVRMVRAHDEPFADPANIPLFMLCEALGGDRKVVLQGDGGDEMFAGYRRYSELDRRAVWRWWPRALSGPLSNFGGSPGRRLVRMAEAAGSGDPTQRMALLLTLETPRDPPFDLLTRERRAVLLETTDPFLSFRRAAARFADAEPVQQMLLCDLTVQLPAQFLPKVDRATMALGVEARVPLLDERVGEIAVGMPARFKVRGNQRKVILRDAFRDVLPAEILDGPKTGFGVPSARWIQGPLHEPAREAVLDPTILGTFGFEGARVERAFEEHRSGDRDWGFTLWKLYQLALWENEVRP